MDTKDAPATPGDAGATTAISSNPTPRPRGGRRGTITRNVGIPKDAAATATKGKGRGKGRRTATATRQTARVTGRRVARRAAYGLSGTTSGNQGTLISTLLAQNGFDDTAKITVTQGRKSLTLPLGLFTGK